MIQKLTTESCRRILRRLFHLLRFQRLLRLLRPLRFQRRAEARQRLLRGLHTCKINAKNKYMLKSPHQEIEK